MASEQGERKLAAILAADIVGYSRLASADEERTLARLRALRSDLIDPTVAVWRGRVVKRTGDGAIIEFRSVVDALRCAIEMQNGMAERNAGVAAERRIEFRIGVHLGDVVEEADGDLMGDGVNIAARLEGIAEPGGICLSAAAYEQVRDKVNEPFVELGELSLKNIARPVQAYAIGPSAARATAAPPDAAASEKPGPPRLSMVVLPFANLGGDSGQDYFVDGVTESLTTDLSRISGSLIIARNTAFTYKGKAADVKKIGLELNVRYVLEGSIQRSGDRMRVNVQLVDAGNGGHLWADRFDKPVIDLFDLQDEIVARLANALNAQLTSAEARRARSAPRPDSTDFYFQGQDWLNKGVTPDNLSKALAFFELALARDATNVDAMVGLSISNSLYAGAFFPSDRAARFAAAEAAALRALAIAPQHPMAHFCFGVVLNATNRPSQCIAECEQALALDSSLAQAHAQIGWAKTCLGFFRDMEAHVRETIRLSPKDSFLFMWLMLAGLAVIYAGEDEEAIGWFRRSLGANRNYPNAHFALAAALANLDRLEEAETAVKAGLALNPAYSIARARTGAASDNAAYLAGRERHLQGMLKAGVPEQ